MNYEALTAAKKAFFMHDGNVSSSIEQAVKAYIAKSSEPGELIVGEAIQPQRDYRKELWIATSEMRMGTADENISFSNSVVRGFDAFFKENP